MVRELRTQLNIAHKPRDANFPKTKKLPKFTMGLKNPCLPQNHHNLTQAPFTPTTWGKTENPGAPNG
jgi:hypothetical protein